MPVNLYLANVRIDAKDKPYKNKAKLNKYEM